MKRRFDFSAARGAATRIMIFLCITLLLEGAFVSSARAASVSAESTARLSGMNKALEEVAAVAKPSVVNISTTTVTTMQENPMGRFFNDPLFRKYHGDQFDQLFPKGKSKSTSLGSGVIISADGYILTNNHVVAKADEIKVTLNDKREFKGRVIGADPLSDLAVVKIEARGLPAIKMGESADLKAGDLVLAIGNPFGLNQTVTMGIVSAIGRSNVGISSYEDFIQTDAAINPGNSGGALVNTSGELVGVNSAIFSTTGGYMGIGFAIPSDMADSVGQSIIKHGKVIRGWLGVSIQNLTPALTKSFGIKQEEGVLVTDVLKNSPAAKAGLRRGDVITGFNGRPVSDATGLRLAVAALPPGKSVGLEILRQGKEERLEVTIGELHETKEAKAGAYNNVLKGLTVQDLTPALRAELGAPGELAGVVVADVAADSLAAGVLKKNDVIMEIDRKSVGGIEEYEKALSTIGPSDTVLLLVYRDGGYIYITLSQSGGE